jgi:hypothetical protein
MATRKPATFDQILVALIAAAEQEHRDVAVITPDQTKLGRGYLRYEFAGNEATVDALMAQAPETAETREDAEAWDTEHKVETDEDEE